MSKPTPDAKDLCETVKEIDGYAQTGFGQIGALAKLALLSLELPGAYQRIDRIAEALSAIEGISYDIQNLINCAAEGVGCNYIDEEKRRRGEALRRHQQSKGAQREHGPA